MLTRLKSVLALEDDHLRRRLSGLIVIAVAVLLCAPAFFDLSTEVGLAVATVASLSLLTILLDHVVQLSGDLRIAVFRTEEDARKRQVEFIDQQKPRSVRICGYSGATIKDILQSIADSPSIESVQILLCHPDCLTEWQRDTRFVPALSDLRLTFPIAAAKRVGLTIRCYSDHASLRGRNYGGQLVAVGWYTHDRKDLTVHEKQVWGDRNALVVADCSDPAGAALRDMFDEVFDNLWRDATPISEAAKDVLVPALIPHDWLRCVNGET
jgi:hypothetical protein